MLPRRAVLAAPALLLASGMARAQITTLDLPPAMLAVKPDDTVAAGHRRDVLIRWGDRVNFDAPPWEPRNPTADAASGQFGWDARLAGIVAPRMGGDGVARLILAVAHPEVEAAHGFPGGRDAVASGRDAVASGRDRPAVAVAMSGASLINLERQDGRWVLVDGGFQSRRLGIATLCRIGGPAAAMLGSGVVGLLGPAGGCATPWGTLLLAEQEPAAWLTRLSTLDARFRDARPFGWLAEIDPLDPQSVPVKRSAIGRIGAQAVAATVADDGRAVVFLADGLPMGFLFRFVSSRPAMEPDALDAGQLSVARIEGSNVTWIPLPEAGLLVPHNAALQAGASPFDTPAALAMDPRRRRLMLALRGGTTRTPGQLDGLHTRPGPHPGLVVELAGEPTAPRLASRILFQAGDAAEGGAYGRDMPGNTALPRHPATLAVDARGRLWIGTDRAGRPGPAPDAVFACDLDGPGRGVVLPVYGAPRAAAIGGAEPTPAGDALMVLVRTPGAEPGSTFDRPATRWPAFDNRVPPRGALVALSRNGGGVVGG